MAKIEIYRYANNDETTIGLLFINGVFQCYTLEDEKREEKVYAETRIPAGMYNVIVRRYGGHHVKYAQRFADIHDGMLEISGVPDFEDILFHCGNTDKDTAGCLLVGNTVDNTNIHRGAIGDSTRAYEAFYRKVIEEAKDNNLVVTIHDEGYFVKQVEY